MYVDDDITLAIAGRSRADLSAIFRKLQWHHSFAWLGSSLHSEIYQPWGSLDFKTQCKTFAPIGAASINIL